MAVTAPHKRFIPLFTTLNLLLFSDVFESVKISVNMLMRFPRRQISGSRLLGGSRVTAGGKKRRLVD